MRIGERKEKNVINDKSNKRTGNIVCAAIKMLNEKKNIHIQRLIMCAYTAARSNERAYCKWQPLPSFNACALQRVRSLSLLLFVPPVNTHTHKHFVDCAEFFHKSIETHKHSYTYIYTYIDSHNDQESQEQENPQCGEHIANIALTNVVKSNENEKSSFDQQQKAIHKHILPLHMHVYGQNRTRKQEDKANGSNSNNYNE